MAIDYVENLRNLIRSIPDFPKPGIMFRDIMPLLGDRQGLAMAIHLMSDPFRKSGIECVVGAESRGFIFGTAIARELNAGFVPVRKPGKLPAATVSKEYGLEYGSDTLEIHTDAIKPGQKVLVVDDLLATGGTMKACCEMVEELGGEIHGISLLIELCFLNGREKFSQYPIHSIIEYHSE